MINRVVGSKRNSLGEKVKTGDFFRVFGIRRGRSKMGTSIERQRGRGGLMTKDRFFREREYIFTFL